MKGVSQVDGETLSHSATKLLSHRLCWLSQPEVMRTPLPSTGTLAVEPNVDLVPLAPRGDR